MEFTIDLVAIENFFSQEPLLIFGQLFLKEGWIVLVIIILLGLYFYHLGQARQKYFASIKYNLLAIDIPKENEQTPKAVEQIFAQLAGISSKGNLIDRYWRGKQQLSISLELISIDGYIQFLIRTPEKFRDLVEAAIYAQYPEAEITEVNDYTQEFNITFPNDKYDLWGTEFKLASPNAYPIRTYPNFEHPLTQQLIDPMASILEILSRLRKGEQIWFQWLITPLSSKEKKIWLTNAERLVKRLIGEETKGAPKTLLDRLTDWPLWLLDYLGEIIYPLWGRVEREGVLSRELINKMQFLSPGERSVIEATQLKLSKQPFWVKFRLIYLGQKDLFDKGRGVAAVIGAINQFNTENLNDFETDKRTKTAANYVFTGKRISRKQNKILRRFKNRLMRPGRGSILNIEELASLYHFPVITVKAPLVKKTESRRGEPPVSLPVAPEIPVSEKEVPRPVTPEGGPPEDLPVK